MSTGAHSRARLRKRRMAGILVARVRRGQRVSMKGGAGAGPVHQGGATAAIQRPMVAARVASSGEPGLRS